MSLDFIKSTLDRKSIGQRKQTIDSSKDLDAASSLFILFHQNIVVISDLTAGCLDISRVIGSQRMTNFDRFSEFLKVLEVYGTGYSDDIDYKKYKIREKESHRNTTIKELQRI